MKVQHLKTSLAIILLLCFSKSTLWGQDSTKSLAMKPEHAFHIPFTLFYQSEVSYQLYENFMLIRKANAGDAQAAHEIGVRYLIGHGFDPDTVQSYKWIAKAAAGGLPVAMYNLGIFQNNGWGTDWNPYKAFDNFYAAAENGFPLGEYVVGLFFTENLVVPRDLSIAEYFIKKAAAQNVDQAKDVLKELEKRNPPYVDSNYVAQFFEKRKEEKSKQKKNYALSFLDFTADSAATVSDSTLVYDAIHEKEKENPDSMFTDSEILKKVSEEAEWGSPEALTLLGRYSEKGTLLKKNHLRAAGYYCRAVRLESYKAVKLLYEMLTPQFFTSLKKEVEKGNTEAMFVWASLFALHFDNQITESDALKFMKEAAAKNYVPALLELGNWNVGGIIVPKNIPDGLELWKQAVALGSKEAADRLSLLYILNGDFVLNKENFVGNLQASEKNNSILAQTALGICYERGYGVKRDLGDAVQYYRKAAFRGSQNAYNALKRIYDALRPDDPKFSITD